jgi:hypothetical protein
MKFGRNSRRSIRYSLFIGVLAGSVFSGSWAFAVDPLTQETFYSTIQEDLAGNYVLGGDIDISKADGGSAPAGATVFGTFTGTLDGANKTISGLTKPLFDQLGTTGDGASVSDLVLAATGTEFAGQGIIANTSTEAAIVNVAATATGVITTNSQFIGGLIGTATDTQIDNSSFSGVINTSVPGVGGLVGFLDCSSKTGNVCAAGTSTINNSHSSGEMSGSYSVGGLVGGGFGEISNSHADVIISGGDNLGGLVGWSEIAIDNSHSSGSVTTTNENADAAGGISGAQGNHLISNSYSTAEVTGHNDVGGLVGYTYGNISNSYAYVTGDITGTGNMVGGLVGGVYQTNLISNSYSYVTGDVTGVDGYVGGLVGYTYGNISNSYAHVNGNVTGEGDYVGGLVGYTDGTYSNDENIFGNISNSYSYVGVDVTGTGNDVGGLAGFVASNIANSYAYVGRDVEGQGIGYLTQFIFASVGGLVGEAIGNITDSYANILGNVYGQGSFVGGLAGSAYDVTNSYVYVGGYVDGYGTNAFGNFGSVGGLIGNANGNIENSHSYVNGYVTGERSYIGGLAGYADGNITNSYGFVGGTVTGGLVDMGDLTGFVNNNVTNSHTSVSGHILDYGDGVDASSSDFVTPTFPTVLETINPSSDPTTFTQDDCYNSTNPYIVSLFESYVSSCGGGDEPPPPPNPPTRERIEREFREVVETRTPEKIEKLDGFKKEATVTKDSAITFVEPTEKIEVAKVKAVEVSATANVRVNAKAGEALQISLKSGSKEPVELWVKSPDGKWLLAGVITFDKDGKAILPPLQFKNVGNYSLVLSKPTADSAKGSAPLDQTGSLLVAVS